MPVLPPKMKMMSPALVVAALNAAMLSKALVERPSPPAGLLASTTSRMYQTRWPTVMLTVPVVGVCVSVTW